MQFSRNEVRLTGIVGKEPEIKEFSQSKGALFSLATNSSYKKEDEWIKETEWHNIVFWGKNAELIQKHVHKGMTLQVDGKIKYKSYERDGQKINYCEIEGRDFIPMKIQSSNGQNAAPPKLDSEDDLPF